MEQTQAGTFFPKEPEDRSGLAEMMDTLPCGICRVRLDEPLTLLYANQSYYELFGYTPEQAREAGIGSMYDTCHSADFEDLCQKIRELIARGMSNFEVECRSVRYSGKVFWMLLRCGYNRNAPDTIIGAVFDISCRKTAEERLRMNEEQNRVALRLSDHIVNIYDIGTRMLHQTYAGTDALGLPRSIKNVPQSMVDMGMVEEPHVKAFEEFFEGMSNGVPYSELVVPMRGTDSQLRWLHAKYGLIFEKNGKPSRAVISYVDITEMRRKEFAYQQWLNSFNAKKANQAGYYECNLLTDIVERYEGGEAFGVPEAVRQSFTGIIQYTLEHKIHPDDRENYRKFMDKARFVAHYYEKNAEMCLEHRRLRSDGSYFWAAAVVQVIKDPYSDGLKAFILIQDIDKEKQKAIHLEELSRKDPLTGLLNRNAVISRITEVIRTAPDKQAVLVMLDIDFFKEFNDGYGHQFGDTVLINFSTGLKNTLREGDVCGRLGGDEFVACLCDIKGMDVQKRLEQMNHGLMCHYEGQAVCSCSVGAALFPRDGKSFEALYEKADIALYEAKRRGRNCAVLYSPDFETGKG